MASMIVGHRSAKYEYFHLTRTSGRRTARTGEIRAARSSQS